MRESIKPPVEIRYQKELAALEAADTARKPQNWRLSPQAVRTFILGSQKPVTYQGESISIRKKYFGNDALVERCIITLAGNRGLMLVGEPGTAKTMLSELLSASISGVSTNTIQGTAGTTEDMIKYSWNYALLLAKGPSRESLVPAPLYVGMERGILTGTANTRDKGVNEMSSALKRRFNFETVMPVREVALEKQIILNEVGELARENGIDMTPDEEAAKLLASTYHELREGVSAYGHRIDKPGAVMSTAEAVSVYYQTMISGYYYGDSSIDMDCLVQNLVGAVSKENKDDLGKVKEYFSTVIKDKSSKEGGLWKKYYEARKWLK